MEKQKKNRTMRMGAFLVVLTLITSCLVGGTLARYTAQNTRQDNVRVANWGFDGAREEAFELFSTTYTNDSVVTVSGTENDKVMAPGTSGSASFRFNYNGAQTAPEVAYTLTVSTQGSAAAQAIKNNSAITWSLDGEECASWNDLLSRIEALSGGENGTKNYSAGDLPAAFNNNQEHTVSWAWNFENGEEGNQTDTEMGNAPNLGTVMLKIIITAKQVG